MTDRALKRHIPAVHGRKREHSLGEIRRDFVGAFLICLILFGVKEWFVEKTEAGHLFEDATYQLLERRLSETLTQTEEVPVTVVDISPLAPKAIEKGLGGGRATPPQQLLQLLAAIAQAEPAGIAVDVDLSPVNSVDVSPGILALFQGAERIHEEQGIPVVLGIRRTETSAPDYRLGFPRYSKLAASMTIPRSEQGEVLRLMEREIVPKQNGNADPSLKIPSISAALVPPQQGAKTGGLARVLEALAMVRKAETKDLTYFRADEFLVDFSPIKSLYQNRIVAQDQADVVRQQHRFTGSLVLLGDGNREGAEPEDLFVIPGDPLRDLIPGVYVHACAAYTLWRAPLFEFSPFGRFCSDILIFFLAFGPLLFWRWRRSPDEERVRLGELLLASVSLVLITIFAHTLVRSTRILWTDFAVGMVAVIVHLAAGTLSSRLGGYAEAAFSPLVRRLQRAANA
jgi:CHASE2 domain-containing sensor protein